MENSDFENNSDYHKQPIERVITSSLKKPSAISDLAPIKFLKNVTFKTLPLKEVNPKAFANSSSVNAASNNEPSSVTEWSGVEIKIPKRREAVERMPSDDSSEAMYFEASPVLDKQFEASPVSDKQFEGSPVLGGDKQFEGSPVLGGDKQFEATEIGIKIEDGNTFQRFQPALYTETYYPIVKVHTAPHMTRPLLPNNAPLDLKPYSKIQSLKNIAPLGSCLEFADHDEDAVMLQILTDEIELLELNSEVGTFQLFLNFFRRSDYEDDYPWAKYFRSIVGEEIEGEPAEEENNDLDDIFTYIYGV